MKKTGLSPTMDRYAGPSSDAGERDNQVRRRGFGLQAKRRSATGGSSAGNAACTLLGRVPFAHTYGCSSIATCHLGG